MKTILRQSGVLWHMKAELTYEDFIGHMSGNYGTPIYCNLCRYELNHKDCDDPKCDLCHYETAMAEDRNGSSSDPGSHQDEGCGDEPIEHDEDDADDEEEEEEDGDDDDTVNENSMPEEG